MIKRAAALVAVLAALTAATLALASRGAPTTPAITACTGARAIDFGCFERRYTELASARGAYAALADLTRQRSRNGYVRAACHQLTHRIGRAVGATRGIAAFDDGMPLCSSGYYHGVIEAVMIKLPAGRALRDARRVCAPLRDRAPRSADHYNCVHGMGHGFMAVFGTDVFASLHGCDALAERWEQHNCYGGVFMENLSAIDNPTRPSTSLRPDQPLYPCTAVKPRYREACFDKQTTYALYVSGGDFATVFADCAAIGRRFRNGCERGLGGDVAIDSVKHVFDTRARAAARRNLCLLGEGPRARANCVAGAVQVILRDIDDGAAQTAALCDALAGGLRRTCMQARAAAYRELPLQPGTLPASTALGITSPTGRTRSRGPGDVARQSP